jgi:rare lipoprotein A
MGLMWFAMLMGTVCVNAQTKPSKPKAKKILTGTASFYSQRFEGKKTANGEIFRQNKRTAACNKLPLGSYVRVTNLRNKKSVKVKINDRLHRKSSRLIDLSKSAAGELGMMKLGLVKVRVETISAAEFRKQDKNKSSRKKSGSRNRKKRQR